MNNAAKIGSSNREATGGAMAVVKETSPALETAGFQPRISRIDAETRVLEAHDRHPGKRLAEWSSPLPMPAKPETSGISGGMYAVPRPTPTLKTH